MGTQREAGPSEWRPSTAAKGQLGSPSPRSGERRRPAMPWKIRLPLLIVLLVVLAYVFVKLWRDALPLHPALVLVAAALTLLILGAVTGKLLKRPRKREDDKSILRL